MNRDVSSESAPRDPMAKIQEAIDDQVRYLHSTFVMSGLPSYKSAIQFSGASILPPLMTPKRRDDMQMYKQQAILVEAKLRANHRKKLLTRVQSVINAIDERHGGVSFCGDSQETVETVKANESVENRIQELLLQNTDDDQSASAVKDDKELFPPHSEVYEDLDNGNENAEICEQVAEESPSSQLVADSGFESKTLQETEPLDHTMADVKDIPLKDPDGAISCSSSVSNGQLEDTVITRTDVSEGEVLQEIEAPDPNMDMSTISTQTLDITAGNEFLDGLSSRTSLLSKVDLTLDALDEDSLSTLAEDLVVPLQEYAGKTEEINPVAEEKIPPVSDVPPPDPEDTTSRMFTASTELAAYMAQSTDDTIHSSVTSIPHLAETSGTENSRSSLRRSSYTLDEPSPALLRTVEKVDQLSELTSSMEDLRLRPVQRQLSYPDPPTPFADHTDLPAPSDNIRPVDDEEEEEVGERDPRARYESEREGKEEHLHRYLLNLSQMPTPSPPQLDRSVSCIPPDFPTETLEGSGGSTLSHGFAQALQTTPFDVQTLNTMDEADLLKIQAEYFERLKLQLMEQQKQQISVLLSQQREQQMALQQSIIASHQASTTLPKPILVQKKKDSHQSEDLRAESAPIPSVHFSVNSHIAASHAEDSFNRSLLSDASVLIHAESPTKVQSATKSPRLGVRHSYDRHPVKARSRLLQPKDLTPELQRSFEKLSALAKGHLTRLLMKSDRVQTIIKTITDTAEFALNFQKETPIKKGHPSQQDRLLQKRLIAQLTAAMYEIHEVFFETSLRERLLFIAQTRQRKHEQFIREQAHLLNHSPTPGRVSAATVKAVSRRKKALAAEASMLESDFRPKSAPPKSSSPVCPQRNERSAIARNYKHLMAKAMKASQSAQHSPIKPVKDNLNKAARDKQTTDVKRHMTSKTNGVNTGKKPGPLRKIARPSVPTQANGHR